MARERPTPMRLIQLFVPASDYEAVTGQLSEMEVSYVLTEADGERDGSLVSVPVPAGAVDEVLRQLYEVGLDEETYTVVTAVDRATVPNLEELTGRYVEGPKGARGASNLELRERADDLKPDRATYLAFAIASAIVAVGGLLLDSAIVIVGAMVIAPFAGSTLSASVGAVVSDYEMTVRSAVSQVLGLVVGYLGAVGMSAGLQRSAFVPSRLAIAQVEQVGAFVTPNLLTLAIAVAAGFAGALALATDLPVSIAGVAVAAAIVPAVAVAGIGTVWGQPVVVLGATVLLLMNIVFINVAAYLTLVLLGYRSSVVRSLREGTTLSLRTGAYAVVVVLFAAVLALTAAGTYEQLVFERDVNREVQQTLGASQYSALELTGVQTNYGVNALRDDPVVTVTVSRTSEREYEELARSLQANISDRTNRPVAVNVRFVDYEEATPPDEAARPGTLLDWLRSWFSRLPVASTGNPRPEPAPHAAQFVGERAQSA